MRIANRQLSVQLADFPDPSAANESGRTQVYDGTGLETEIVLAHAGSDVDQTFPLGDSLFQIALAQGIGAALPLAPGENSSWQVVSRRTDGAPPRAMDNVSANRSGGVAPARRTAAERCLEKHEAHGRHSPCGALYHRLCSWLTSPRIRAAPRRRAERQALAGDRRVPPVGCPWKSRRIDLVSQSLSIL